VASAEFIVIGAAEPEDEGNNNNKVIDSDWTKSHVAMARKELWKSRA
jgi:hypothetical protein